MSTTAPAKGILWGSRAWKYFKWTWKLMEFSYCNFSSKGRVFLALLCFLRLQLWYFFWSSNAILPNVFFVALQVLCPIHSIGALPTLSEHLSSLTLLLLSKENDILNGSKTHLSFRERTQLASQSAICKFAFK